MIIDTSVTLDAPIERAWAVLTDFAGYRAWNPYLVQVEGQAVAGTIIRVHAATPGRAEPLVQDVAVLSVEPFTMRWEGGLPDRSRFRGDHWFVLARVEGDDRRCTLHHFEAFDGTLAPAILAEHGATIRANFDRFNLALKALLESRA